MTLFRVKDFHLCLSILQISLILQNAEKSNLHDMTQGLQDNVRKDFTVLPVVGTVLFVSSLPQFLLCSFIFFSWAIDKIG